MKYFLLLLLLSGFANAQLTQESKSVLKIPDSDEYDFGSSSLNREGKKFGVFLQLGGADAIVTPVAMSGIGFSYFADHNSQIALQFLQGDANATPFQKIGSQDLSVQSVGVKYKRFFGNSFYVKGGPEQRRLTYSQSGYALDATATTVDVGVGNQWQWRNFSIGCDWISMVQPLGSSITNETSLGGNANARYQLTQGLGFSFLNLYVGANF